MRAAAWGTSQHLPWLCAPTISCCVRAGGGGSINYTMIHESSTWLAEQLGAGGAYTPDYWDTLKQELGKVALKNSSAALSAAQPAYAF